MKIFFYILGHNIIPIFLLMALGFALGKKFKIDLFSLSKLNLYLFMPAFILVNLYVTNIDMSMLKVFVCGFLLIVANGVLGSVLGRMRGYSLGLRNAFKNSIMFNNVGNIGVSLITLIYASDPYVIDGKMPYLDTAIGAQIVILFLQSVMANTWGLFNAGRAKFKLQESLQQIFSMPSVYILPVVFLLKVTEFDLTATVMWPALEYLKNGLVPMALLTLGIQLARTDFDFKNMDVHLAVFTRLIIGPVLAIGFIYAFGFSGVVAQTVLIAHAVPTAVNTVLTAVECDNHPDFASQAVMLSSLFSAVTLTAVIYAARIIYPV